MIQHRTVTTSAIAAGTATAQSHVSPIDSETSVDLYTLRTSYSPASGTYGLKWDLSATSEPGREDIDMQAAELERILNTHHDRLRDEIAEAVGDQHSSIADLQKSVTDLRDSVADLRGSVSKLSDVFHEQSKQVAVQQSEVSRLQEDVKTHAGHIDAHGKSITRLMTILSVVGAVITAVLIPVAIAAIQSLA